MRDNNNVKCRKIAIVTDNFIISIMLPKMIIENNPCGVV